MNNYSEIIGINSIFQNSINLEIDLNDENKIKQYIPTPEGCLILNYYLNSILDNTFRNQYSHSTTLVGPYGKGKSFLLLVLLFIISHDINNRTWKNLRNRIAEINKDTAFMMDEISKRKIKLMPVLLNNDYEDLKQVFLVALSSALNEFGIKELMPETSFDVALKIINKWESNSSFIKDINLILQAENISLKDLKKRLRNKEKYFYNLFVKLYNSVIPGQEFNPFISDSIVSILKSVATSLKTQTDFSGIYFVFDEFSKFLDSETPYFSEELKTLQDIFELCNRTEEKSQIHICCVIHKPLSFYANSKGQAKRNSFKTIEGRVKEILFARSINENFQLIEKAIIKKKAFNNLWKDIYATHKEYYQKLKVESICTVFDLDKIIKGCFPLNPYSVYSLIQLSEKVAQNERTLFSFISDKDKNSLNSFVGSQKEGLLNVDRIYDYFSPILASTDDELIKRIYYKTEACLSTVSEEEQKKTIKALAVSTMIDDPVIVPPIARIIALSLAMPEGKVVKAIEELERNSFIRKSSFNGFLSFSGANSAAINEKINNLIQDSNMDFRLSDILETVTEERFALPRKYNAKMKMTRFYKVIYISADTFLKLGSLSALDANNVADGLLIKMFFCEENENLEQKVREKYSTFNSKTSIVLLAKHSISRKGQLLLKEFRALEEVERIFKDDLVSKEIKLMRAELKNDLAKIFKDYFNDVIRIPENTGSLSEEMSTEMFNVFTNTPIINNELLNKNNLSATYSKARKNVIKVLLNRESINQHYKYSSPEVTIYNSIFRGNKGECFESIKDCFDVINNKLLSTHSDQATTVKSLVEPLRQQPYGLRKGVIPLLVAKVLGDMPENYFMLLLDRKEIPLNESNLEKAIESQDNKYKFKIIRNLAEKRAYISELMTIFELVPSSNFGEDIIKLINAIKNYCLNLPGLVKASNEKSNILKLNEISINFVSSFLKMDINPYEKIFDQLPCINTKKKMSYAETVEIVRKIKNELDNVLIKFENSILEKILNVGCFSYASFVSLLIEKEEFAHIGNVSKEELIDMLSVKLLHLHIRDWNYDRTEDLIDSVSDLLSSFDDSFVTADSFTPLSEDVESPFEESLMNMLRDNLDSFGDALSKVQKLNVLYKLIKEIQ